MVKSTVSKSNRSQAQARYILPNIVTAFKKQFRKGSPAGPTWKKRTFADAGFIPDTVMSALDADVIK